MTTLGNKVYILLKEDSGFLKATNLGDQHCKREHEQICMFFYNHNNIPFSTSYLRKNVRTKNRKTVN